MSESCPSRAGTARQRPPPTDDGAGVERARRRCGAGEAPVRDPGPDRVGLAVRVGARAGRLWPVKRRSLALPVPSAVRRTLPALAAGAIAVTLTAGCQVFSPVQTDVAYAPADGVPVDIGQLALRDLVLVGDGSGEAVVSGSAVNLGGETITMQLQPEADPATGAAGSRRAARAQAARAGQPRRARPPVRRCRRQAGLDRQRQDHLQPGRDDPGAGAAPASAQLLLDDHADAGGHAGRRDADRHRDDDRLTRGRPQTASNL